jgi:lipopolysaccharide export LptBFGC system permease protein LptF
MGCCGGFCVAITMYWNIGVYVVIIMNCTSAFFSRKYNGHTYIANIIGCYGGVSLNNVISLYGGVSLNNVINLYGGVYVPNIISFYGGVYIANGL